VPILSEQHGIDIGYSTLSRIIRELGFGKGRKQRCHRVPDEPGKEMQHDTSPYSVKFAGKPVLVQGSLLYFRYCKARYLKFYRAFNRFMMKCFFHEALTFWRHAADECIIDNTNLARLVGTGKNAVICPEMAQFAKQYGFKFVCHEKGHANRKAGNERGFYTVETNFFPGREFVSLEDMNRHAFEWATHRMAKQIDDYLDFAIKNGVKQKHRFIRALYGLYRKMAIEVFIKTVSRALKYRITDIKTIERIATLQLTSADFQLPLPQIDRQLEKRDAYIEGYFADDVDLSIYDQVSGDNDG
jgi:hypothetical protein